MPFGKRKSDPNKRKARGSGLTNQPSLKYASFTDNSYLRQTVVSKFPDERPYVDVVIFNKTFDALIDTGAMLTFISDEVAKHLNNNNRRPTKPNLKVHLADRSQAVIKGSYRFPIVLNETKNVIDAIHVTKLSTPVIIGMDLVQKMNLISMNVPIFRRKSKRKLEESSISKLIALKPEEQTRLQIFWMKNWQNLKNHLHEQM